MAKRKSEAMRPVSAMQAAKVPSWEQQWATIPYWHPETYSAESAGKWLLFYRLADLDRAWLHAKSLCDGKRLPGVVLLHCATAKPRPKEEYPIMFCTEKLEPAELLGVGQEIVKAMAYKPMDNWTSVSWVRHGRPEGYRTKVALELEPSATSPWERVQESD
jgi:hypothetical protein